MLLLIVMWVINSLNQLLASSSLCVILNSLALTFSLAIISSHSNEMNSASLLSLNCEMLQRWVVWLTFLQSLLSTNSTCNTCIVFSVDKLILDFCEIFSSWYASRNLSLNTQSLAVAWLKEVKHKELAPILLLLSYPEVFFSCKHNCHEYLAPSVTLMMFDTCLL